MRAQFLLLLACLYPAVFAFVARVPHIDRRDYGLLLGRESEIKDASNATISTANATSNATATDNSNSTAASATPVATVNISEPVEDDGANSTSRAPGELPIQPSVTPALGVGGFILLVTGGVLALIGVRNLWIQVFLSSAFLTSLGVTVLIVYVMSPPVPVAIQGAYLVAIFFTGVTFGALAIVFKELAEGLGCLLGGFCTGMWLLSTRSGGLIKSTDAKTGFIGAITVGFYAVSFSHYTRPYGLIVSTSIAGGTVVSLGIDCYSKAGLKEFWLYLWALNDDIFPLGTDTYPVTRYIKVELAATVIVAIMGVISQLRLWKVVRERRAREDEKRQEEQRQKDEAEAEVGKRLEEDNLKERMEWEAKYGNHKPGASESSASIPDLATCHADEADAKDKEKDDAEKKSIADSEVSYRCSDCRARGDDDASDTDITGSKTQRQDTDSADKETCVPSEDVEGDGDYPKALRGAISDDKSSDMTAIVGSESASIYSKRLSMLSHKASVKSAARSVKAAKPVSESQEALVARHDDDDVVSTVGVVDDADTDCHTVAANSQYQAMLDEELPTTAQYLDATAASSVKGEVGTQVHTQSTPSAEKEVSQPTEIPTGDKSLENDQIQKPTMNEVSSDAPKPDSAPDSGVDSVEARRQQDKIEKKSTEIQAEEPKDSAELQSSGEQLQADHQPGVATSVAQPQDERTIGQHDENHRPEEKPSEARVESETQGGTVDAYPNKPTEDQAGQADIKGEPREDSATHEQPAKGDDKPTELLIKEGPSKEKAPKKEEPKRLDAETVEQIPKHTSRVVQAYRMNEWAKHLANADIPEPEPIQPLEDRQPDPAEEEAAPVNVTELLQTPLNAQPPPAVESRKDTNEVHVHHKHDSRTGSQKNKRRSKSPRRLSGHSVGSAHVSQNLAPAVQPQIGNIATPSSITLSPGERSRDDSEKAKPRWKGPAPLIAVREDMMRSRLSSLSLPTDPYTRHNTGQSPTDFPSRYPSGSTFAIPEEDDDDIPLSQRRTMLHQQVSPVSPTNAAPSRWNNAGVPSRANFPAVLAAWRESVRDDLGRRDPLKLAQSTAPVPGDHNASPYSQLGQRNSSASIGDRIAEGMQKGDMSDLHREALRRMQAKANQSVDRLI
ncbi:hypothetical protein BDW74DRAFT_188602 [Aspergillus multicolor]|uniref:uncharacterized protein n=1 Tax=Aspergillus multicolor TaxID=41759 RepID=UPI003CCD1BF2